MMPCCVVRKFGSFACLLLGAGFFAAPVKAHPHGQITCSAKVSFQQGRPQRIALALEVDADNSAKILHQQIIDPKTGEPQGPRGLMLKNLMAKAFREQDWLVSLRSATEDALGATQLAAPPTSEPAPGATAPLPSAPGTIPWLEKSPVSLRKLSSGALLISLDLEPDWSKAEKSAAAATPGAAASEAGSQYVFACQDPSWFWMASFADKNPLQTQSQVCQAQPIDDQLKMPNAPTALLTRFKLACPSQ